MTSPSRRLRAQSQSSSSPDDLSLTSHQAFIRSLPCLSCGKRAPSECAYVGMLGLLPSHWYFVPLCGPATVWQDCCHSRKHHSGAARFWAELGLDPIDLAFELWRVSGDLTAGLRTITEARESAAPHYRNLEESRSSYRSGPNGRAAFRQRLRPTGMAFRPRSAESMWSLESRS